MKKAFHYLASFIIIFSIVSIMIPIKGMQKIALPLKELDLKTITHHLELCRYSAKETEIYCAFLWNEKAKEVGEKNAVVFLATLYLTAYLEKALLHVGSAISKLEPALKELLLKNEALDTALLRKLLGAMGTFLYRHKKFNESLMYLEKAIALKNYSCYYPAGVAYYELAQETANKDEKYKLLAKASSFFYEAARIAPIDKNSYPFNRSYL